MLYGQAWSYKHAAGPFMASTFQIQLFVRENSLVTTVVTKSEF
jgi:hypothetical protein